MDKQEVKEVIQDKARALSMEHPNLALEMATGVGKTKALLKCIASSTSTKKWLVLVPETPLIENFKEEMIKHGYEHLGDKIEDVICYQSLHKYTETELNLGLDEGHHLSDLRTDLVKTIKSDQRILLSATLNEEVKERMNELGEWFTYRVDMKQAVELGILPGPQINVVEVKLDNRDKNLSYKIKGKTIKVTERGYYDLLDKNVNYWLSLYQKEGKDWMNKRFMKAALDRKTFISQTKSAVARELIDTLKGSKRRMVVFCGSVDQAQNLGGCRSVHSRNTKEKNLEIITDFNEGNASILYANKMLREGMNLVDTEVGVLVQLDNQEIGTIQMTGRVLRSEQPEIYILVAKGTKDEDYLTKALKAVKVAKEDINYITVKVKEEKESITQ